MNDDEPEEDAGDAEVRARLAELKIEHQDLDAAVGALAAQNAPDQIQIARLKKKKLMLKDVIMRMESRLRPDIIA
jgi:hypothetical protein